MSKNLTFNEALEFCTGAQENKDVAGWRTLKEYESVISNPSFDVKARSLLSMIILSINLQMESIAATKSLQLSSSVKKQTGYVDYSKKKGALGYY